MRPIPVLKAIASTTSSGSATTRVSRLKSPACIESSSRPATDVPPKCVSQSGAK
jgi:hypothetical protein